MKPWIVILSDVWPWPGDAGNRERLRQLIRFLKKDFRVCLVAVPRLSAEFPTGEADCDADVFSLLPAARWLPRRIAVKMLGLWRRHCGGLKPLNAAGLPDHSRVMEFLLSRAVKKFRPVAIIGEYVWTVRASRRVCDGIPIFLDLHDIISARGRRQKALGMPDEKALREEEEISYWRQADVLLAIQDDEAREVQRLLPSADVLTVPHSPGELQRAPASVGREILCVGSAAAPNVDGLERWISSSWKSLSARLPGPVLSIVGSVGEKLPPQVKSLPGIQIHGCVPDLGPFYRRAAVVLNPVRYGSGLKIKSVEALAFGKCLVTTPAGAEGIPPQNPPAFLSVPEEELAEAVAGLLEDSATRTAMEQAAARLYDSHFSPESCFGSLRNRLLNLQPTSSSLS